MRHIPNDKYTIAWFKLAECVAKGEKEKAFGVYRLLMHSLEDQAYAHQLEGDLLGAFSDERAPEKYAMAAQLYQNNSRYKEAAALYEDLMLLVPHDSRYILKLIDVYTKHKSNEITIEKLKKLLLLLREKRRYEHGLLVLKALQENADHEMVIGEYIQVMHELIGLQLDHEEIMNALLQQAIALSMNQEKPGLMQSLLAQLEQSKYSWYQKACEIIASIPQ
jgi:tetratricopeptide (TPR) repeat protein